VALGYFRNFKSDNYSLEVETYYKSKKELDYIDGADLIANKAIEQIILNGQLRSGLEVMLRKNKGKKRMDFLYLIKIRATNSGRTAEESGINSGNWYNSNFDKLHNVAVTSSYNLNEKWSLSQLCTADRTTYKLSKWPI
jgi:hypothetical protein